MAGTKKNAKETKDVKSIDKKVKSTKKNAGSSDSKTVKKTIDMKAKSSSSNEEKVVKSNTSKKAKVTTEKSSTKKKTTTKTNSKKIPKVSSKTTKLNIIKDDKNNSNSATKIPKKSKEKSAEKSRKANAKKTTSRRIKRDATKIIPVDKILEAQRKLDEMDNKQNDDFIYDEKEIEKQRKKGIKIDKKRIKKKIKKKKNKENLFNKIFKQFKSLFDFSNFSLKTRKIIRIIVLVCVSVIIIESIYLLVLKNTILRGTYYDTFNSISIDGTEMVAVGSSDFNYSKENKFTKNPKAKIIKYDKNGNIMFEKMYEDGISSNFSSVIEDSDGYVAVGSYIKDSNQLSNNLTDAIIIKYDKDGKKIWSDTFSSLSNTKFNKVISVDDGYIVIGQSIYANMEMGNSTEGGGVILKYSKDGKLLWKSFHGGTKSASFNGVVEVNGWLYVVGRDGTDFGNIVQYNSNGVYQWHKNYRYTDTLGLSDIVFKDDKLYAVGSKEIFDSEVTDDSERNTSNTDALLICFGLDGEIIFEKTFGGSSMERFNSVSIYKNNIIAVGSSNSNDSGLKIYTDGEKTSGILVKYDIKGNIENKMVLGGSNVDNITSVKSDYSSLFITSYTSSKDGNISTKVDNGKDYFGRIIKLDSRLHILFLK